MHGPAIHGTESLGSAGQSEKQRTESSAASAEDLNAHDAAKVLGDLPHHTDVTDISDGPVSNSKFLQAIFSGLADPLRPFTLGFPGTPRDHKAWSGEPWRPGQPTSND